MSGANGFGGSGKKAVHVKWAGKTIALGTFPASEADEKCARAKALTRAWRSTMRPKPTRDWVMTELERLGVRVVSGRLGRKAGEEGEEKSPGPMGVGHPPVERSGSIGWGTDDLNSLMAGGRRPSMNLAMMGDGRRTSIGSLGPMVGLDGDAGFGHRGLGSGFDVGDGQRRASSLGLGSLGPGGFGNIGMSVNPNQHYEMLKLHHMNLLNEIQETTLMMNLYQQQQLQQQQQQLQLQAEGIHDPSQLSMMQQNGMGDGLYGANQLSQQQRASLGLGSMQMMASQQQAVMSSSSPQPQRQNRSPVKAEQASPPSSDKKRPAEPAADDETRKRPKTEEDSASPDSKEEETKSKEEDSSEEDEEEDESPEETKTTEAPHAESV